MKIPETLQERLSKRKIIPFVGAGVSMPVLDKETDDYLFPCWRDLLEQAAGRLDAETKSEDAQLVRAYLGVSPPNYLAAAGHARDKLGATWFRFLKDQVDLPWERVDEESLRLAKAVWRLGSRLVITTNYDRVLRWACPDQHDLQELDIQSPAEQVTVLRNELDRPTLWHLHGRIDKATELILTPESYKHLYPDAGQAKSRYQAALQTLRYLLSSHSFLFVGFSLDDAHFGLQLLDIHDIFEGANGPHFVLAREADRDRIKSLNPRVEVVTFPDFDDLPELVENLSEYVLKVTPPVDGSKPLTEIKGLTESGASFDPRKPYFSVPFRAKGNQVIGREEALQAVHKQLTQGRRTNIGQTAAFRGLGGLGKTQLAVEYAYLYKDEYPNGVYWLTADQNIDAQLTDLAEKAGWVSPQSEHKYKLDIALQRLRTHSDCLIIFDNLEDIKAIKEYLPEPQANPHILATSRTDQPGFAYIALDFLNKDLSLRLLLQEAERDPDSPQEWEAAGYISEALGGLPLALEMAGAYLRHLPVSWKQYRDLLSQNLKAALPSKYAQESFTKPETDLYSTLKINESVFAEEPRLKGILDLLTWSGSSPMGLSLMCALLDVKNETELTSALGLGIALRLLQKPTDAESYAIHRLVREVRREDIPLADRQDWINAICQRMGDWFQEKRREFTNLPIFEAEIDHLQAWQRHALILNLDHSVRLTWLQGYPPYHRGRYLEAKEWVEKAQELFDRIQPKDQQLKAYLLEDLSTTGSTLGFYQQALIYDEAALAIKREIYEEGHFEIARSLSYLGTAYFNLGEDKLALDYFQQALAIRLKVLGERHPDTALSLGDVGRAYNSLGDYKLALDYFQQALAIRLKVLGERHPDTASSLNDVGTAYSNLQKHDQAVENAEKALTILLELFGERHPETASSYDDISTTYLHQGNPERAIEYGRKALKLHVELLGDQHPDTVVVAGNLARALYALNRPQALQLLEEYLYKLPKDHIEYETIKLERQLLLREPVRKGFRNPPSNPAKKKKPKNKKKR